LRLLASGGADDKGRRSGRKRIARARQSGL